MLCFVFVLCVPLVSCSPIFISSSEWSFSVDLLTLVKKDDSLEQCDGDEIVQWKIKFHECFIERKYGDGGRNLNSIVDRIMDHAESCTERSNRHCRPDYDGLLSVLMIIIEQMKDYSEMYLDLIYKGREHINDLKCVDDILSIKTYETCFKDVSLAPNRTESDLQNEVESVIECINLRNKGCSPEGMTALNNIVRALLGLPKPLKQENPHATSLDGVKSFGSSKIIVVLRPSEGLNSGSSESTLVFLPLDSGSSESTMASRHSDGVKSGSPEATLVSRPPDGVKTSGSSKLALVLSPSDGVKSPNSSEFVEVEDNSTSSISFATTTPPSNSNDNQRSSSSSEEYVSTSEASPVFLHFGGYSSSDEYSPTSEATPLSRRMDSYGSYGISDYYWSSSEEYMSSSEYASSSGDMASTEQGSGRPRQKVSEDVDDLTSTEQNFGRRHQEVSEKVENHPVETTPEPTKSWYNYIIDPIVSAWNSVVSFFSNLFG